MKQAIIKALCYADIFDYPLTIEEIHQQLTQKTTIKSIISALNKYKFNHYKGLYYLPGRKKLVNHRLSLVESSNQKLTYAQSIIDYLTLIPTVSAIYLTGALAMDNSTSEDDIDLMIVTKPGYLWTTRFIVNILLDLIGIRRKPTDKQHQNKLCLNLWLDETSLKVSPNKRSLYMAHEISQAKLIWQRYNIHSLFLSQNSWITKYLPNVSIPIKPKLAVKKKKPGLVESALQKLQSQIMKSKQTSESVSASSAFFHPRNTNQIITSQYNKRINKYLS